MSTEKIFANGFYFDRKENAPDFVVGKLSMTAKQAIEFINEHKKENSKGVEQISINILKSRKGGYYIELDTYLAPSRTTNANEDIDSSLPF